MSRGQLFVLMFAFILKHCLTQAATSDLIALLNALLPGCLPPNLYFFNKITDVNDTLQTCIYCNNCETFIGKYSAQIHECTCPDCDTVFVANDLVKSGNFFLMYPLEQSLRDVLELNKMGQLLISTSSSAEYASDVITDVCDGSEYSSKQTFRFPSSLSLTANVDGVPVFKSSNQSLWPVYYVVNNLPLALRRKNIILHGLWSGVGKPKMNCFLTPMVDELVRLKHDGLTWTAPSGSVVKTVINLDLIVADSVARPLLQNFKQFNGTYGCGFCMHKGSLVQKGVGYVRTYPVGNALPQRRLHSQSLQFAAHADECGSPVFGVKGVTPLYQIPDFNIVTGFNPEYMHSVLLGVVRQLVNLWFDPGSRGKSYSLRAHFATVDGIILGIKPPSEIKRLPRSLNLRSYWKASEWKAFLLSYSIVCLKPVMPNALYRHWLLLVYSVYMLLSKEISDSDLLTCDLALHSFVSMIPELYGEEHVSFNIHLLTHIVDSVRCWGPLWASSAFVFEDANRQLLRWVHGANAVSRQIFRSYVVSKHLQPLAARYVEQYDNASVCQLLSRYSHKQVQCENVTRFADGVVGLGIHRTCSLTSHETLAVESLLGNRMESSQVCSFE